MSDCHRIANVELDERSVVRRSADVEHERKVAIYDLLEDNHFAPVGIDDGGPYNLHLAIAESRLILGIRDIEDKPIKTVILATWALMLPRKTKL